MRDPSSLLRGQGRHDERVPLLVWLFMAFREEHGLTHHEILPILYELGSLLGERGWLDEAEVLYRQVIDCCTELRVQHHPDTLTTMAGYLLLLKSFQRWSEAEPLCRRLLEGYRTQSGLRDKMTLNTVNHLSQILQALGRIDEAAHLLFEVCRELRHHGVKSPLLSGTAAEVAQELRVRSQHDMAEKLLLEADPKLWATDKASSACVCS